MRNELFMDAHNIKAAGVPADLDGNALAGARVKLDQGKKLVVLIHAGDSTGAAFTVDFDQHDAASSGNSKALDIKSPYYHKVHTATEFTKVEIATATDSFDLATQFAAQEGVVAFEINDAELDVENGYGWVSVNIADTTAAKVVSALYIVKDVTKKPAYDQTL